MPLIIAVSESAAARSAKAMVSGVSKIVHNMPRGRNSGAAGGAD